MRVGLILTCVLWDGRSPGQLLAIKCLMLSYATKKTSLQAIRHQSAHGKRINFTCLANKGMLPVS